LDLRRLLTVIRRWSWLLVVGTVAAGATAYAISTVVPEYESRALLLVGPGIDSGNAGSTDLSSSVRAARIYSTLATSRPLLTRVIEDVGLDMTPEELKQELSVTTTDEPPLLTIDSRASDPEVAAAIANSVSAELLALSARAAQDEVDVFVSEQLDAVRQEIEAVAAEATALEAEESRTEAENARLADLQARLGDLQATFAALTNASSSASVYGLSVIEGAEVPTGTPGRLRNTLLAALLGFALALAAAFLFEHLDETLKTGSAVERLTGLKPLGEVGRLPPPAAGDAPPVTANLSPYTPIGEDFRRLRIGIEFVAAKPFRSLLVTSSASAEGKTTIASHLAAAFGQAGWRVVAVDADLRNPSLHRQFSMPNAAGLSELLANPDDSSLDLVEATTIPRVRLLTAGTFLDTQESITPAALRQILDRLKEGSDLIVIDGPSVTSVADTEMLASSVDGSLLVVAWGSSTPPAVVAARDALLRANARVLGSVLNGVPRASRGSNRNRRARRDTGRIGALSEDPPTSG